MILLEKGINDEVSFLDLFISVLLVLQIYFRLYHIEHW